MVVVYARLTISCQSQTRTCSVGCARARSLRMCEVFASLLPDSFAIHKMLKMKQICMAMANNNERQATPHHPNGSLLACLLASPLSHSLCVGCAEWFITGVRFLMKLQHERTEHYYIALLYGYTAHTHNVCVDNAAISFACSHFRSMRKSCIAFVYSNHFDAHKHTQYVWWWARACICLPLCCLMPAPTTHSSCSYFTLC